MLERLYKLAMNFTILISVSLCVWVASSQKKEKERKENLSRKFSKLEFKAY
jgi:hypothetical protein